MYRLLCCLLLALTAGLFVTGTVRAAPDEVLVVLSKPQGAYQKVSDALRTALIARGDARPALTVVSLDDPGWRDAFRTPSALRDGVVVTVGAEAASEVMALHPRAAVLATLIPRLAYMEIMHENGAPRAAVSALFIDQPFARQLELIRLAFPEHRHLAVVLGPSSRDQGQELHALARTYGFRLETEQISETSQLLPALNRVLEDGNVLLSVADPMIFNSHTIQYLLLTTYRDRVPVIGLSRAYVEAGALAAVYSSPEQIGRQVGEILLAWPGGRAPLPPPQYPRYYSVAVNERVAASLELHLEDESTLLRRLQAAMGQP